MKPIIKKGDALTKVIALDRASHRCEMRGTTLDFLDPHHLLPKSIYPQHRFEPMNIALLCRKKCHREAEESSESFLSAAIMIPQLQERIRWRDENEGVGKYPTEVDYEAMYAKLKD